MAMDDLEGRIVDLLRRDPQTSNKAIATKVGVSETTVAARIRSLTDRKLIRVTVQRDIKALGDNMIVHLDIFVEGRWVQDVGRDLSEMDSVANLVVLMGSPQLIAQVHARDGTALVKVLEEDISKVAGIVRIETTISLETLKYRLDIANLQEPR